jgi:hypothetical protein
MLNKQRVQAFVTTYTQALVVAYKEKDAELGRDKCWASHDLNFERNIERVAQYMARQRADSLLQEGNLEDALLNPITIADSSLIAMNSYHICIASLRSDDTSAISLQKSVRNHVVFPG